MTSRRTPAVSPLPIWAGGLGALALYFLLLPLAFMLGRINWVALGATLVTPEAAVALGLSMRICVMTLGIDLILGIPAALVLLRSWWGVCAARIFAALPLSLPPIIAGVTLLAAFGRRPMLGALLDGAGLDIASTTTAVVIAQVFMSLPFLIVTLESALRSREQGLDETASSLGALPSRVFWQITLPTALPGLGRGAALALACCPGEFGAILTFAGSMQGVARTMSLQIHLARESDTDLALALGVVLLDVTALVVALTETPWGRLAALIRSTRLGRTFASEAAGAPYMDAPADTAATSRESDAGADVCVTGTIIERGWSVDAPLRPGLVTAIVGHNGAGRSTLARVITGTLRLDEDSARIGGRVVDDVETFMPARRRGVAMVSQTPCIFIYMSVLVSVAFPLQVRGVGRVQARVTATDQLRAVGIADLARRRTSDLSGGQAAHVAIARALVFWPDMLILDEPTAALDVETIAQVSAVLRERLSQSGITALLVSHDITEVLALALYMVVIGDGRVVEEGEPARTLASSSSVFAARLAGLNIVTDEAIGGPGMVGVRVGGGALWAACDSVAPGEESARIALTFPPEAMALSREEAHVSPRSVLPGAVAGIGVDGSLVSVRVALVEGVSMSARVTASARSELGLGIDGRLWASVKVTQIRAIPIAPGS